MMASRYLMAARISVGLTTPSRPLTIRIQHCCFRPLNFARTKFILPPSPKLSKQASSPKWNKKKSSTPQNRPRDLSGTKWALVTGEDGFPQVLRVSKKENRKLPFEFSVERKFRRLKAALGSVDGWNLEEKRHIKAVEILPPETLHDVYYDTADDRLVGRSVYVRRRDGKWEGLVRVPHAGSNKANERWQLYRTSRDMGTLVHTRAYVRDKFQNPPLPDLVVWRAWDRANFGLDAVAEYKTTREGWKVEARVPGHMPYTFYVYWDKTDFGHEVGKVEVRRTIEKKTQRDAWKREQTDLADQAIEKFMEMNSDIFEVGAVEKEDDAEPMGKLRAYRKKFPRAALPEPDPQPVRSWPKVTVEWPWATETTTSGAEGQRNAKENDIDDDEEEEPTRFVIRRVGSGKPKSPSEAGADDDALPAEEPVKWAPFEEVGVRRVPFTPRHVDPEGDPFVVRPIRVDWPMDPDYEPDATWGFEGEEAEGEEIERQAGRGDDDLIGKMSARVAALETKMSPSGAVDGSSSSSSAAAAAEREEPKKDIWSRYDDGQPKERRPQHGEEKIPGIPMKWSPGSATHNNNLLPREDFWRTSAGGGEADPEMRFNRGEPFGGGEGQWSGKGKKNKYGNKMPRKKKRAARKLDPRVGGPIPLYWSKKK